MTYEEKRALVLEFIDTLTREDARTWLREIFVNADKDQLDRVVRRQNLSE